MAAASRMQYKSLQAGRGIAALLVVVHHAAYVVGVPDQLWHREDIFQAFGGLRLGVEFFFVLSGIVIFTAHKRDMGHPETFGPYVWKRFRRVYPIYWIVLLAWVALYLGFGNSHSADLKSPIVLISNFLLVRLVPGMETALVVAWTLFHEVLFYAIFGLILLRKRLGTIALAVWMLLPLVFLGISGHPWLGDYLFSPLHIIFGLGMLVAVFVASSRVPKPKLVFGAGMLVFTGCVLGAIPFGNDSFFITQAAGFGSAVLLLGAMELERQGRLRISRSLIFLGDGSYSLYLAHMPAMLVVSRFLYPLSRNHGLPVSVCFCLFVLIGTAVGIACYVLVERPLLALLGSRQKQTLQVQSASA